MQKYLCAAVLSVATALTVLLGTVAAERRLNDYIRHFDSLSYDTDLLHKSHSRAKRSVDENFVSLKFKALDRSFNLRLKRDTSIFKNNLKIQLADGSLRDHDTSYIYEGYLKGEPNTRVHGSIIDGRFAGRIHTPTGAYFVDKAEIYFTEEQPFHSVIYHETHVDDQPARLKRSLRDGHCGGSDVNVAEWMEKVQNSATEDEQPVKKRSVKAEPTHYNEPHHMYSRAHNMNKRQTRTGNERTCSLFLQTDPQLWEYMTGDNRRRGELGYSGNRANEEITSLLADHVSGIKAIYENTEFSDEYRGFTFVVWRIQIMNHTVCDQNSLQQNRFCAANIDVTNFLNLNSLSKHDEYCLAYMFTYRDFTGGTLGLAWVGSNSRAAGGVCEQWKEYTENGNRVKKSLNTGIVTLVNYGSRVPPKVSTLTFAHEVGHNFGSPHDSGRRCTPYTSLNDNDGNYIMFASATSGERPNNKKFSECSKSNVSEVLDAIINERHSKKNCFVDSGEAFCGNGIVEGDEQCDCGYAEDCRDRCCYGRNSSAEDIQCTRRPNVQCSPSEGPCCNEDCTFMANYSMVCKADTECAHRSSCNGSHATCPLPAPKSDDTLCNENTQICIEGDCQGSICTRIGWTQCYLTAPNDDAEYDKGNLCYVACENPDTEDCVSSSPNERALNKDENQVFKAFLRTQNATNGKNLLDEGIKLPPGAPCDNFKGYCDVFSKCRGVDADGPLAKLKKLFFSQETYASVRKWITVHWWAVMLMGIGLVVGMGVFIAVCAVHTPSSNPNKRPARKVADTLRRRPRPRAQGPPRGYGGSGPSGPSRGGPSGPPPPYNPHADRYEMKPNRV